MTAAATAATPLLRLLAGYRATGRPADLREHLARYGPQPFPGIGSRSVDPVEEAGLTGRGGGAFPTAPWPHPGAPRWWWSTRPRASP
jgi:NADH:ubiquinone oxidoreductase subunit F (NADH-binding)